MPCSNHSALKGFAEALLDGLKAELFLTPKPGLVDLRDSGSHADLSLPLMLRSIGLLEDYFAELVPAIERQEPIVELRLIGVAAEQRMLKQLGCNSHRGGIFLCGLLLTAYGRCGSVVPEILSAAVAEEARRFFNLGEQPDSHGGQARTRYRTGGIIAEACNGLPGLFAVALPAFLAGEGDFATRAYLAMSRLMQHCDDTTTLHRGGQTGLARLRKAGAELEACLLAGNDATPLLLRQNQEFCRAGLTMGGVADLLGVTFGYLNFSLQEDAVLQASNLQFAAIR